MYNGRSGGFQVCHTSGLVNFGPCIYVIILIIRFDFYLCVIFDRVESYSVSIN